MNKTIKTLSKVVRDNKKQSILTPVFVAFEVIIETSIPLIMALMIDTMGTATMTPIYVYGTVLVLMALCSLLFGILGGISASTASTGFARNLRHDLFFKVQDFSFVEINKFSTSSLVTRLTTDVTNTQMAYFMTIRIAVRAPLMVIFALTGSFLISWKMGVLMLCIIPFLSVGLFFVFKKVDPIFRRIFKKYDRVNNSVKENVEGIRVTKSFARERHEQRKFDRSVEAIRDNFTHAEKVVALNTPIMNFSVYIAILLVSLLGSRLIIQSQGSELTSAQLSSVITYAIQILSSLFMLSQVLVMISLSTESAHRIAEVLQTESTLDPNLGGLTEMKDGSIIFENVNFKYNKESTKFNLEGINLHIKSGQTIGIIGSTGSAKTTMIQLIPRLFDTTEGSVIVGGNNVKDYNLKYLRDNVAVVLQKNVLFSGSIYENVRWGNKDATDEQVEHVCKMAQADEFIQQLSGKYNYRIERGGTNVSGGQKQRLCIARALLKKPKIIIFDDSTSAVDTKTDSKIRAGMTADIPGTTKIIIAQRVSSIQDADRILVMDTGRIIEDGNHESLMVRNGIYKEIFTSQTKGSK